MKIAVVGVTGSVGRELLSFFEEEGYVHTDIFAVENKSPMGTQISYGEDYDLDVHNLDDFDFSKVNIAVFATSKELSKKYIKKALAKNIKIIDTSSSEFGNDGFSLVVAGVNNKEKLFAKNPIVSTPLAETMQVVLPLSKIHEKYKINRIVSTAYISASFYGHKGMDELFSSTRKVYANDAVSDKDSMFKKQIAFNIIPQVGEFIGDETSIEWQVNAEVKKIIGTDVKVHVNCAFVPTFIGVAQFVNVECEEDIDADDARDLMKQTNGVVVFDKNVDGGYFSLTDIQGENNVYISRVRQDVSVNSGISFWVVSDNLRVGVAKNVFEIVKSINDKK